MAEYDIKLNTNQLVDVLSKNDDTVMRLIGALLAEKDDEWQASSKYFDIMEFWQWMAEQVSVVSIQNKVLAINW